MKVRHLPVICIAISLTGLGGCVGAYGPPRYAQYRAPMVNPYYAPAVPVAPYGGYNYGGYAPPQPYMGGMGHGENREFREYGGYRRYDRDDD